MHQSKSTTRFLITCFIASLLASIHATAKTVSGYWASYGALAVDNVPYSQYDHLNYFVFTTTPQINAISLAGIYEPNIYQFVKLAHGNGTKVSMTVGGYTGSQYFSSAVGSARNRTLFAKCLISAMNKYDFDGITIDWEYPNTGGLGNIYSPNDASNLLLFFQTLRSLAPNARLAYDAQITGIVGPDGNYLTDLSSFAQTIDYFTLMAYDIFGFWSATTGPNNPLYACLNSNPYSIDQAYKTFTAAGVPAAQLIIGFPAYAYAYSVIGPLTSRTCGGYPSVLYQQGVTPLPAEDVGATGAPSQCGNWVGAANPGQYLYKDLVTNHWLVGPRSGFTVTRDTYSQSVSIFSSTKQLFIPYDDPTSAAAKARYVSSKGMAGMEIFDISGDTTNNLLVQAIAGNL
ncbi:glycoside hydrolase [Meredithblackwellia eburnea MCA 4105]